MKLPNCLRLVLLSSFVALSFSGALGTVFAQGRAPMDAEELARHRATAAAITRRGAAAKRGLALIERSRFQVRPLARQWGKDVDAAVAWVAEETRWIPYQGALRGGAGVLQDRCGSHLDRALLLGELLKVMGQGVRLARTTLSPADARALLIAASEAAPLILPDDSAEIAEAVVQSVSRALEIKPDAYRGAVAAAGVRQSTAFEEALGTCLPIAGDLIGLLEGVPGQGGGASTAHAEAAADLWWVQSRSDDESPWVNRFLRSYEAELDPAETFALDAVPDGEWHSLEIRVELERRAEGKFGVEPLLVETLIPAQAMGEPVSLAIQCLDPLPKRSQGEANDAYRRRLLLSADYWMPVLRIGDRVVGQAGFELDGSVDREAVKNVASRAVGKASDLIAGLGKAPNPAVEGDALVALRCVFTTRGPGAPPRALERMVFDALGPGERADLPALPTRSLEPGSDGGKIARALGLAKKIDLLAWGFRPSEAWLEALTLFRISENARADSALAKALPAEDYAEVVKQFGARKLDDSHLWAVVRARHGWNPEGSALAAHELQLLAFHTEHLGRSQGDGAAVRLRFDWMNNVLDPFPGRQKDGRSLRVLQGVVDTYAEAAIVDFFGDVKDNAARIHETGASDGRMPAIATPEDLLALGSEGRAWREASDRGDLIVMATGGDSAPGAAWRIDPSTGATLGIDREGHGNAFADHALQLQIRVEAWIAENKTLALAICIACKVTGQFTSIVPPEVESLGCGALCLAAGAG